MKYSRLVALVVCVGGGGLSGCGAPRPGVQAQADAATRAACENRAEQAYDQQGRGEIYSPQSQVNIPYSANYTPSVTDRGLSDLFAHDRMVSDCVRNTGTGADRSVPSTSVTHRSGTVQPR